MQSMFKIAPAILSVSMSDECFLRGVAQQAHSSCGDEGTLHVLYEGLVSWDVFLWFGFFTRVKAKLPGAIFNMLCMARSVNATDGIHK